MRSKVKQILSIILTVCMLVTVAPLNAYAADADFGDGETTDITVDADEAGDLDVSEEESTDDNDISADIGEDVEEDVEEVTEETPEEELDAVVEDEEDVFSAGDTEDTFSDDETDAQAFDYVTSNNTVALPDGYMKIFHLDAGRKYFTVSEIEDIIDTLSANGYNYMELAIGNDGLRFLLNDMSVTVGEETYSSDKVTKGIKDGNRAYTKASTGELSEAEMDSIISYATSKGVSIIPLLNSPGHMDAIIDCMESLKMKEVAYESSVRTIDVTNAEAVKFTTNLIAKYVTYFAGKGCKVFNMGADEYANDTTNGFSALISKRNYKYFVDYVNSIAAVIRNARMVPMAFNDGIYYNSNDHFGTFDSNIAISYWTPGWSDYNPASALFLAGKGHSIINTNDAWYYVLGRRTDSQTNSYNLSRAQTGVNTTKYNDVPGDNDPTPAGSMICMWCDEPEAEYSADEVNNVKGLITTFASNNQEVFTATPSEPNKVPSNGPANAMTSQSINLEYWITNNEVYKTQSKQEHVQTITTETEGATTENGISISDIAPSSAYSFFDGTVTVYYWQTVCLDQAKKQTGDNGVDRTADGTTLTNIRYYDYAWQYKTLEGEWKYFLNTDQLVSYYLQKTEVTKEVETYSKDWGYSTTGTTPNTSSGNGQVALTVAVVYPNGIVAPEENSMYSNSTTVFNYWSGRDIGIVAPKNNSDYNISKITVTDGKRNYNPSDNVWYNNDTITWNTVEDEDQNTWYDETEVWNKSSGTTPMVNGKVSNIAWTKKNTAKLVLIYLETVQKKTNLNVKYVDDSDNSKTIAEYQIAMSYNQGDPKPSFLTAGTLHQTSQVHAGEFTLDDDAYVVNSKGQNEKFNKNLVTLSKSQKINDIKYLSGAYKYAKADISDDGKTLTLHYMLDQNNIKIGYVVDFGEKVNIPLTDLVDENVINNVKTIEKVSGSVTVEGTTVTYVPEKVLTALDYAEVRINFSDDSSVKKKMVFMPATTVYYEETFVNGGSGAATLGTQKTERPGRENNNNYGYDQSYANGNNSVVDLSNGAQSFAFKGTGVDIYAKTGAETGTMMIKVKEEGSSSYKKLVAVDTKMAKGTSDATGAQENLNGNNVPVATLDLGSRATYEVSLSRVKSGNAGYKPVYFDGFRVYNTLQDDGGTYAKDNEANPAYYELRNQVIAAVADNDQSVENIVGKTMDQVYASGNVNSAVVVDPSAGITSEELKDFVDNGPKNELYLSHGQSVVFSLNQVAQIGLKGVNGNASYSVTGATINNENVNRVSTTDMFYRISAGNSITITNTGNTILSITKIKAFNTTNAAKVFAPLTEETLTTALVGLGYEKAPAPTVTATPTPTQKPAQQIKLDTPKLDKVAAVGHNALKVSWSKVKNADGYRVYVKENGKWKTVGDTKSTSYVHKNLKTGKSYTYTVKAYKKTADGTVWSSYNKKGITGKTVLKAPKLRRVKKNSAKKATLTWNKVDGANGYVVYRKTNNGSWKAVKRITKGNVASFTDTKLSKGKKYTYTVRAYCTVDKKNVYSGYDKKGLTVK